MKKIITLTVLMILLTSSIKVVAADDTTGAGTANDPIKYTQSGRKIKKPNNNYTLETLQASSMSGNNRKRALALYKEQQGSLFGNPYYKRPESPESNLFRKEEENLRKAAKQARDERRKKEREAKNKKSSTSGVPRQDKRVTGKTPQKNNKHDIFYALHEFYKKQQEAEAVRVDRKKQDIPKGLPTIFEMIKNQDNSDRFKPVFPEYR